MLGALHRKVTGNLQQIWNSKVIPDSAEVNIVSASQNSVLTKALQGPLLQQLEHAISRAF